MHQSTLTIKFGKVSPSWMKPKLVALNFVFCSITTSFIHNDNKWCFSTNCDFWRITFGALIPSIDASRRFCLCLFTLRLRSFFCLSSSSLLHTSLTCSGINTNIDLYLLIVPHTFDILLLTSYLEILCNPNILTAMGHTLNVNLQSLIFYLQHKMWCSGG